MDVKSDIKLLSSISFKILMLNVVSLFLYVSELLLTNDFILYNVVPLSSFEKMGFTTKRVLEYQLCR